MLTVSMNVSVNGCLPFESNSMMDWQTILGVPHPDIDYEVWL